MSEVVQTKLIYETKKGRRLKGEAVLAFVNGRIEFLKSPFELKDEIKAMKGSKWHGFDEENKRKIWSVEDCHRNRFQLAYLQGEDPYAWFDREIVQHKYERPLMPHQCELADHGLTFHFNIWAAEMGVGKTLAAIEVMEKSGVNHWWYVGPKKVLEAIKREFKKWKLDPNLNVELLTYEGLTKRMDTWTKDQECPQGVIFDESSRLKTADAARSRAAQYIADMVRWKYGHDGYVILMSGTPSPKTPVDWWSQAEIAYPGFLREGSERAFKSRLAFLADRQYASGGIHKDLIGWKDDERKCAKCGIYEEALCHDSLLADVDEYHPFQPSVNEVALLYERLGGLVIVKHKKDCLSLPDKRYRRVYCKPSPALLRTAQALVNSALTAAQGATQLRELSDGFLYREQQDGMTACTTCDKGEGPTGEIIEWFDTHDEERRYQAIDMLDPDLVARLDTRMVTCPKCEGSLEIPKMIRVAREVPCPKEDALRELLEENYEHGRVLVFGGFTGTIDRIVNVCLSEGWAVVRCDGRGFVVFVRESDGQTKTLNGVDALDYWADRDNAHVAFVAHPESGGMGLTLTEACMAIFVSNSYKPEYRGQSEDRIHRPGIDENLGATIVDIIHLPTDEKVLDVLRENRTLELMTLGEVFKGVEWEVAA